MKLSRWLCLIALVFGAPVTRGESGTVTGRVPMTGGSVPTAADKYAGKISGRVAPPARPRAAVWIDGPDLKAEPVASGATFEQRGYQFVESLLVVPVGARVAFPNLDPDYHNVFSLSKAKRFDLGRYKPEEKPAPVVTFDKPGIVRLFCEIHEHMRGTIVVVDTPYFTRTAEDGTFTLGGVPPGSYTLRVWLDERRNWQQPVVVTSRRATEASFAAK